MSWSKSALDAGHSNRQRETASREATDKNYRISFWFKASS